MNFWELRGMVPMPPTHPMQFHPQTMCSILNQHASSLKPCVSILNPRASILKEEKQGGTGLV